jgi:hypothetical protein
MIKKADISEKLICGIRAFVVSTSLFLLFCAGLAACRANHRAEANTAEQNYVSSMSYLLGTSSKQAAELEPIWVAHQETENRLSLTFQSNTDELFEALAELDQKTVSRARAHLDTAQSARLEEIFAERRQMAYHNRERADKILKQREAEGPLTEPPDRSKKLSKPSPMGNTGGVGGMR